MLFLLELRLVALFRFVGKYFALEKINRTPRGTCEHNVVILRCSSADTRTVDVRKCLGSGETTFSQGARVPEGTKIVSGQDADVEKVSPTAQRDHPAAPFKSPLADAEACRWIAFANKSGGLNSHMRDADRTSSRTLARTHNQARIHNADL